MQAAGQHGLSLLSPMATGALVSNTYPTCPLQGDSPAKAGLIPYVALMLHDIEVKGVIDG